MTRQGQNLQAAKSYILLMIKMHYYNLQAAEISILLMIKRHYFSSQADVSK